MSFTNHRRPQALRTGETKSENVRHILNLPHGIISHAWSFRVKNPNGLQTPAASVYIEGTNICTHSTTTRQPCRTNTDDVVEWNSTRQYTSPRSVLHHHLAFGVADQTLTPSPMSNVFENKYLTKRLNSTEITQAVSGKHFTRQ